MSNEQTEKPNSNRYVILTTDPDEIEWSIIHSTESADDALDFWRSDPSDPSLRIMINTGDYITFDTSVMSPEDE